MKIGIVVLNYNGLANTLECLNSIRKLENNNHTIKIFVVDNASTDGSAQAFAKISGITLIANEQNFGYTGGNNIGIYGALKVGCDATLVLNNDTIVHPLLIVNLIKALKNGDIITPKIYFAPGFEYHKGRYHKDELGKIIWYAGATIDWQNIIGRHIGVDQVDKGQFDKQRQIDLATGAAILIKKEVFAKIGYFDEKYFLYLEDMDFSTRAKKANFKIIFEPTAILWHKNAGSTGGSGSILQDYYISRNRLLFAFKYANTRTKLAVLKQLIRQSSNPIKRKALIDFSTFHFGKGRGI